MAVEKLSDQDHERIAEAIRTAEDATSGEIYCVVAQRSDGYFFSAALIVTVSILLISLGVAFLIEASWLTMRLPVFVAAQLLALAGALAAGLRAAGTAHRAGAAPLAIHPRARQRAEAVPGAQRAPDRRTARAC